MAYSYDFNFEYLKVLICLETAGAILTLTGPQKTSPSIQISPSDFLTTVLSGRLIYSATLPAYDRTKTFLKTYKVMSRSQNAHAYVNAGFRITIDPQTYYVQSSPPPCLVYGGISEDFVHALQTERFLLGKQLNDPTTLVGALNMLSQEISPSEDAVLASAAYRKSLALSLFYKFMLIVCDKFVDARYKSATSTLIDMRELSSAQLNFPSTPSMYPLTQPIVKLNGVAQTSGETKYVYDREPGFNELNGTYILSTAANCTLDSINTAEAQIMPGFKTNHYKAFKFYLLLFSFKK
jgi:xanthine dehydrogenase/oxidase